MRSSGRRRAPAVTAVEGRQHLQVGFPGRSLPRFTSSWCIVGQLIGWIIIRPINSILGWLFRGFNKAFDRMTAFYGQLWVACCLQRGGVVHYGAPGAYTPGSIGRRRASSPAGQGLLDLMCNARFGIRRAPSIMAVESLARETPALLTRSASLAPYLILNAMRRTWARSSCQTVRGARRVQSSKVPASFRSLP